MQLEKDRLYVAQEKVTEYLLNTVHPDGGAKAYFFLRCGFQPEAWNVFADRLIEHGSQSSVVKEGNTPFGKKYVVEGLLKTSLRHDPLVRTVWFLSANGQNINLVTAYPLKL